MPTVPAGMSTRSQQGACREGGTLDAARLTVDSLRALDREDPAMDDARPDPSQETSLDELRREVGELRASRARVVAAGDDLRRAVERDLHDGVQQQLVALAVKLQLARHPDTDPAALQALLDDMGRDVQDALDDVRRLAWSVYPSLLLDRGLADALRAAASEIAVSTGVEAQGIGRYPADIEAAVYFCCLELLNIAAERADPGGRATVRLRQDRCELLLDVCMDLGQGEGLDLTGAADRVGAVGGLMVKSEDGRTVCVSAAIPVDR